MFGFFFKSSETIQILHFPFYSGVVNVKHAELNTFMKIAQQLQIKGLATPSTSNQSLHPHASHHHLQKSSPPSPYTNRTLDSYANNLKRSVLDYSGMQCNESSTPTKQLKRSADSIDNDISTESMENMSSEDGFPVPQVSMIEPPHFDLSNVKRETNDSLSSPGSSRNSLAFRFDYNRKCLLYAITVEMFVSWFYSNN